MSKNVFYIECSVPFWLDVAEGLQARQGWKPVYWTGHHSFEAEVNQRFPDVCFHPNADAVKSTPAAPHQFRSLPPLDEALLNDLAVCERNTLQMMDRLVFNESLTYWDRVRLYHRYLRYWLAMLQHYQPSAVIFPNSPHLMYDFVLYELCKRQLVPTFLFSETAVNGLIYPASRFENCSEVVVEVYKQLLTANHEPALCSRTVEYLQKIQGTYSQAVPPWQKPYYEAQQAGDHEEKKQDADNEISEKSRNFLRSGINALRQNISPSRWSSFLRAKFQKWKNLKELRLLLREVSQADPPQGVAILQGVTGFLRTLQEHGRQYPEVLADAIHATNALYKNFLETYDTIPTFPAEAPPGTYQVLKTEKPEDSRYNAAEYQLFRILGARKKISLKDHYEKIARTPDFQQPYIYVALHYQPEKATCPEGGVFVNQYLIIDLLSKTVPPGWKVYVKEHPFQFELCGSGELTRTHQFYDDVAALPNVQLVPVRTSPFDLIDHSRAVATVTGTTGWESILRGKPVLVFGHAWYKGCEGVFYAATQKQCEQAVNQIALGYKLDSRKVRIFLKALENVGFYGYTILDLAQWSGINHKKNVEAIREVIEKSLLQKRAA